VVYNNRGSVYRAKRDMDRALADLDMAIQIRPSANALTQRGLVWEAKGDPARAKADFEKALSLPQRDDSGKWGHDTARVRLAVLTDKVAPVPQPPVVTATPSADGTRVALVIGNGAYAHAPRLPNPVNDARAVATSLRELGFDVLVGTDLAHGPQERLVRDFLRKAATARVALVFYAGHGMQVDGKNYLVPVDAKLEGPSDLAFATLELDKILNGLDDEARTNIIILDACRDNPLANTLARKTRSSAVGGGLAAISTVGTGTLIAYATAPGKTALDGAGANSPFTTALIKHLRNPSLEVRQMLTMVRKDVVASTGKQQVPWDNSSLLGEVYLARK
jgi:tetratricopeptide (TPR) repeat protein